MLGIFYKKFIFYQISINKRAMFECWLGVRTINTSLGWVEAGRLTVRRSQNKKSIS